MNKPSVVERAKIAWRVFRSGYPQVRGRKAIPLAWPSWRLGKPEWHIVDLQSYINEGFNANSLIYSAVMYKARSAMIPPLRAYGGDPDHPELLKPNHPLAKLAARPNPSQSWREFQALQEVYFNISGNAYGLLVRASTKGLPDQVIPLNPQRVYIIPGERGTIKGYLHVPEGKPMSGGTPILSEDVMHTKLPNPGDALDGQGYGLSPFSAMAQSGDVDNMVTKFLKLFFERGAMVTGVLEFQDPLSDIVVDDIKARWMEMYGSYENWTDIGVLDRGGKYNRMSMTFDEMGFENLDERNESRILGPFGVPLTLIPTRSGMAASTYNNKEQDRRMFWEDTMVPEIGLFEVEYQYYLQSEDGGFLAFDMSQVPALRKDVPKLVTAWKDLVSLGVPKNRAAELTGLDLGELEDGDVIYMPINMIPIGGPAKPQAQADNQGAAAAEDDTRDEAKSWTPDQKATQWKAVDAIAESWQQAFQNGCHQAFEHDKREILALLSELKARSLSKKATVDWDFFRGKVEQYLDGAGAENWRSVFAPLMQGVIADQGMRWANELGLTFDAQNLFARDWFNDYTLKFSRDINQTTKDIVAAITDLGQGEGWSIPTMQGHLETAFRQMAFGDVEPDDLEWYTERMLPHRTELIARDQTLRSSNAGNHTLFKEWQVPKREWLTTLDGRERDSHRAAIGQVREMGVPFDVGGQKLMFPGDDSLGASLEEIIQCRCTELPVLES